MYPTSGENLLSPFGVINDDDGVAVMGTLNESGLCMEESRWWSDK